MALIKKIKAIFLADAPPGNAKYALESSWSLRQGIQNFRQHQWRKRDLEYILILPVLLFCFIICEKPPALARIAIALLLLTLCTIPATSQFFLNFLPTGTWLILFYSCRYIPPAWRPSIFVRVLPGLENIFYGGNLSAVLASKTNTFLDILAWIPYGLVHFGAPFVVSLICFLFGPPYLLRCFMFAFGYMNIIGLIIQICFPNAPPWYQEMYGLQKANYGMDGSPGGLARIDKIIGIRLYSDSFGASPQVFGAFPSLHSGSAVMEALFMSYLFPQFAPLFMLYVMWIWWSTMYLTHHYFVDLIGGAILTLTVYKLVRITIMPRIDHDKFSRWSYDNVEFGIENAVSKRRHSIDIEAPGPRDFDIEDEYEESHELSVLPSRVIDSHLLSRAQNSTPISRTSTSTPVPRAPSR